MNKQMLVRIVAFLLVLFLLIGIVPVALLAQGAESAVSTDETGSLDATAPSQPEIHLPEDREEPNTITPAAVIGALLGFVVGVVVTTAFFIIHARKKLQKEQPRS